MQTNPLAINLEALFHPPSLTHLFGTDELGRDVLARLVRGMWLSIQVGVAVLLLAGSIGTTIGVMSGWFGGWVDALLMRVTDVFLAFPGILIAIAFTALAGPGVENVVLALGLMGWVTFARLARVQTLALKGREHIQAAVLCGTGTVRLLLLRVLPNISAPLIVEGIFTVAGAIVAEAGLSFLGIGVPPPEPSLGTMLREGARYMLVSPHLVLVPGIALMMLVLALNVLGDKLRERLDVRHDV